jgi:GH24 family phage-related lysozyme (muramidase)
VEAEFSRRVTAAEAGVVRNVRNQKLTQDQFDALVSLTFNAGVTGSSKAYAFIDRGDFRTAASHISSMTSTHVNGKKVVARGLIARRAEESTPFRDAADTAAAVAKK